MAAWEHYVPLMAEGNALSTRQVAARCLWNIREHPKMPVGHWVTVVQLMLTNPHSNDAFGPAYFAIFGTLPAIEKKVVKTLLATHPNPAIAFWATGKG